MEIATTILREALHYAWNTFFLCGSSGVLAIAITSLRAKLGYTDKFPIYVASFATVALLLISFFGVVLPLSRDANENGICAVEGIYENRVQKGNQGRSSDGTVCITTFDGEKKAFSMVRYSNPNSYQQYLFKNFPAQGPFAVRLYYAEHSKLALYMEVIE